MLHSLFFSEYLFSFLSILFLIASTSVPEMGGMAVVYEQGVATIICACSVVSAGHRMMLGLGSVSTRKQFLASLSDL